MRAQTRLILALGSLVLLASATAFAGSITISGNTTASWLSWNLTDITGHNYGDHQPYWNGTSSDGNPPGNIGNVLLANGMGTLKYWGENSSSTGFDPSFYFSAASFTATYEFHYASYYGSNTFGYYYVGDTTHLYPLLGPNTATKSFTPTSAFGLYIQSGDGHIYYTQSNLNTADKNDQHFAVFLQNSMTLQIGIEDKTYASGDRDFQDMVIKMVDPPAPAPEAPFLIMLGIGLAAVSLLAYRFRP